jgi:hypothetical protein
MIEPRIDADGIAQTELDHFGQLPGLRSAGRHARPCSGVAHAHEAEIEISEGPEPPPSAGFS